MGTQTDQATRNVKHPAGGLNMTNAQNTQRWAVSQRNQAREAMAKQLEAERAEREAQLAYVAKMAALIAKQKGG